MIDWLFHLLGLCPDAFSHPSLFWLFGATLVPAAHWIRCQCRRCMGRRT